jgi:mono/diheme cytochrome c family protein
MRKATAWIGLNLAVLSAGSAAYPQDRAQGRKLYTSYCVSCHGEQGKGDGPAAAALPVKPANHTDGTVMNQLTDKFLVEIISKGGGAVGKSPIMPGWGGQFNEKQIRDIIAYVRSLAQPPYQPGDNNKRS